MKKQTIDMKAACPPSPRVSAPPLLEVRHLSVATAKAKILNDVNCAIEANTVFGIIGPSGAGKSTLLRAMNRLIDLTPALKVKGDVLLNGASIYDRTIDPDAVRARIGMLFQQPVVFPTSILENVVFGARRLGKTTRKTQAATAERALSKAALWAEVKDRLRSPAMSLSVGQQQRLCLARTLAVEPEIILMDEPTSALDPKSTQAIEDLILRLKERHTIVIVTHNVAQARRLTDWIACVCVRENAGQIVESACCDVMLENPQCVEVIEFLNRDAA